MEKVYYIKKFEKILLNFINDCGNLDVYIENAYQEDSPLKEESFKTSLQNRFSILQQMKLILASVYDNNENYLWLLNDMFNSTTKVLKKVIDKYNYELKRQTELGII